MFERCVGLAWCSGCRVYSAAMVHVPRTRVLIDALEPLSVRVSARLRRSEASMVDYPDRQGGQKA